MKPVDRWNSTDIAMLGQRDRSAVVRYLRGRINGWQVTPDFYAGRRKRALRIDEGSGAWFYRPPRRSDRLPSGWFLLPFAGGGLLAFIALIWWLA